MSRDEECTIPNVIYDMNSGKSYMKGRFFGKVRRREIPRRERYARSVALDRVRSR